MCILSSCVSGRSIRSVCHFTQWKLNVIRLHHPTIRSWIVMMRYQSYVVLWKILSDFVLLATVTDDSVSHKNHNDHIYMVPAQNNVPRTASPATSPPSSHRYEVISEWIPSSGPPPRRRSVSYFFARNHPLYRTPNSTDPSLAIIKSTGSSKSSGNGFGSAGMSPTSL
jgi:hypothetical protein